MCLSEVWSLRSGLGRQGPLGVVKVQLMFRELSMKASISDVINHIKGACLNVNYHASNNL